MKPYTIFLALLLANQPARAMDIPCTPVESGGIRIDGLLSDWEGADGIGVDQKSQVFQGQNAWSGTADLSFELFCNYDEKNLYLAINVRDEYFIRTRHVQGDDHVMIHLGGKLLIIYPSNFHGVPGRMTWGKSGRVKDVRMAEALQEKGYSVELGIPWGSIPVYHKGVSSFPGAVWVADSDSRAGLKVQTIIGTAPSAKQGQFSLGSAQADLASFLNDKKYTLAHVRMKQSADVVGDKRLEQVLLVGKTIAIIGEDLPGGAYFYLDLPVAQAKDVQWLKLLDLNGDGKKELVSRYTEKNQYGRRDLIVVFRFNASNQFVRAFAHEVLKGQGQQSITNRVTFQPYRRGPKKGLDIIFDKPVAKGFTAANYQEEPATDCFPILLPWEDNLKQRFRFEGEEFFQK